LVLEIANQKLSEIEGQGLFDRDYREKVKGERAENRRLEVRRPEKWKAKGARKKGRGTREDKGPEGETVKRFKV
jgi:hypothetical protein